MASLNAADENARLHRRLFERKQPVDELMLFQVHTVLKVGRNVLVQL